MEKFTWGVAAVGLIGLIGLSASPATADAAKVEGATAKRVGDSWSFSVTLSHGDTGWDDQTAYDFRFVYTQSALQVFVEDVLELSIAGSFPDGRLGFYNFSQGDVRYSAFESEIIVPEPGTALFFVSRGDGTHYFSDTYEEHNRAVRKYQLGGRAQRTKQ